MTPNVFHSLLRYRPREGRSSRENFLTAAFAYTLSTNADVCRDWVAHVSGTPVRTLLGAPTVKVQAIFPAPNGKTRSIVDMVISCGLAGGGELTVIFEHKWDAPADPQQIDDYCAVASSLANTSLVFIAPSALQIAKIEDHRDDVKTLLWRDVYDFLRERDSSGVQEFADFLALMELHRNEAFCRPGSMVDPHTRRCVGSGLASSWATGTLSCGSSLAETVCSLVSTRVATGPEDGRGQRRPRARKP